MGRVWRGCWLEGVLEDGGRRELRSCKLCTRLMHVLIGKEKNVPRISIPH